MKTKNSKKWEINRTVTFILILCVAFLITEVGLASNEELLADHKPYYPYDPYESLITNYVRIEVGGVYMPIGRFLLLRRKNELCAVKFTKVWNEDPGTRIKKYAKYISYYQNDGSGNLLSPNVKVTEGQSSELPFRAWTRLFIWQPGMMYVQCGPLKISWGDYSFVSACEEGDPHFDRAFEFAPTPLENINDVNVSDKRIKWYRYDKNRKTIDIHIDKLREETEKGK